jgi:hypothetical protein
MKVEGEKLVFYLAAHWKRRAQGFWAEGVDKGCWRSQVDTSRLSVPCARLGVPCHGLELERPFYAGRSNEIGYHQSHETKQASFRGSESKSFFAYAGHGPG